ncbi:integrin beta-like protein B isoform X2 [Mytilus californianus]|uniref:integrin beta-like protein B isoform X2 n=1 Tax=Mytilus californianus TaxID=6549 RepID=UPI00224862C9|nr:integrin beta-like protein B isoform X2 [Mytilus californianus]
MFSGTKSSFQSFLRGGIITWKQTGTQQIEISYRLAFRRDYSSNHMCDDSNIINGDILNGEGVLQCDYGCSGIIANPMSYYCTDYSVDENWAAGQRSVSYNFTPTTNNVFQFRYGSCCWISLVVGSGSWVLLATADLSVRQDTGKINTSPVSVMQPIVRFKYGCSYSLRIPVQDDDGDIVKCRWANNTECYAVCEALPGAELDETACLLSYTASGNTGWYAAALQIEDYAVSDITTPLSSVPLQFLIEVASTTDTCDDKPLVLNLTNVNDSVASLTLNATFFQTIIANSGSTSVNITEIATVSPVGMIKTELLPYGSSGTEWHVNVTWTPSQSQAGSHIFCYTAVNSVGQSSDQACVTIKVDDENECASNPCQNGGACVDDITRYICTCPDSYTGKNCETDTDFCEGSICENNGTCVDGVFNHTCTCPTSHTGFHCESAIDFCQYVDLPCRNGGTCIDGVFDYKCTCPLTHTGDLCDTEADNTGYVLSLIFVSGGLVLSGIVTVVVIKSLVSYVKGPGSSVDTHNHFYM